MAEASEKPNDETLRQQLDYYSARASEYDEWFSRTGRYDRGEALRGAWMGEIEVLRNELDRAAPCGDVLELACGTGLWTERLLRHVESVTVVDGSAEMLDECRKRVGNDRGTFVQADLFRWKPERQYDFILFAFWLSHVPREQFDLFWETVAEALAPGGRVFFVDSDYSPESTATDHAVPNRDGEIVTRSLNDGREFRVVKVFYEPDALTSKLADLGWDASVHRTGQFFLYGSARRANSSEDTGEDGQVSLNP